MMGLMAKLLLVSQKIMTAKLVVHLGHLGRTFTFWVCIEGSQHKVAGITNKKVKKAADGMQAMGAVGAPKIARWPHPYDTAKQLMESHEAHVLLVEDEDQADEAALSAFKAAHPAQGEHGWWIKSMPFSRQEAEQERPKRPRSPLAAASPPAGGKRTSRQKKRALVQSPQFGVVKAMLKKNM